MKKTNRRLIAGALCLGMVLASQGPSMLGEGVMSQKRVQAADTVTTITIDGNDVHADNKNGLTYKGFGLLSANSTSDLLMDYKAEQPEKYLEIMQYLFGGDHPLMNHVKVEMGNDRNNSTGSESCTMRTEDEKANVKRNVGFILAADAKKINPNIKVSLLRWNAPKWADTTEKRYTWYKNTILAAYETFGYMVDYVNPNTNEAWHGQSDIDNIKQFSKWIQAENSESIPDAKELELYQKIKFIVSDEAEMIAKSAVTALTTDEEYAKAVSVVGWHYPYSVAIKGKEDQGIITKEDIIKVADEMDLEVWSSENQAVFTDSAYRPANNTVFQDESGNVIANSSGIGGGGSALEMANFIVKSFVDSRRTHVIYQPVIGGFYQGGQYSYKELVGARDPWSGYVRYDAGTVVLNHLSKFAVTGWENEDNTAGIWRAVPEASYCGEEDASGSMRVVTGTTGADSYLTLASPAKDQFSTLFVNNSAKTKQYKIQLTNMSVKENQSLQCFETKASTEGAFDSNYMVDKGDIAPDESGCYSVTIAPFSVVTVSSLQSDKQKIQSESRLPKSDTKRTVLDTDEHGIGNVTDNAYLYADNFDYSDKTVKVLKDDGTFGDETEDYIEARGGKDGAIARYTNVINGAFEAVKDQDGNYVLRQQLDESVQGIGGSWNMSNAQVVIGDYRWMNYRANIDVRFNETNTKTSSAMISIRQTGGGSKLRESSGYSFDIDKDGAWKLYRKKVVVLTGTIDDESIFKKGYGNWNTLSLEGKEKQITVYVNGHEVTTYKDENPVTSGRMGLECSYASIDFDNLSVMKLDGTAPYYEEYLDNLQQYEPDDVQKSKLVFNDKWSHQCGQGMYVYERSASYSTGVGAKVSYDFVGTGLDVIGYMRADKCTIKVTVDGKVKYANANVLQAEDSRTNYSLRGLKYGAHSVTMEVVSGTWCIDSIGICSAIYGEDPNGYDEETPSSPTTKPTAKPDTSLKKNAKFVVAKVTYSVNDAKKKTVTYKKLDKKVSKAEIPDKVKYKGVTYQVTQIGANAFSKSKDLKKVSIGKNVTKIESKAFYKKAKLKEIKLRGTKLKSVGSKAINGISSKAVISCPKAKKPAYKKLFKKSTGFKKTMKIK